MAVYKKNNRWYIDYYQPDGKRKREIESIKGLETYEITRQHAIKALTIRKAQIAEGKFEIAETKKPVSFDRFVKRYLEYSKSNKKSWERDITSSVALLRTFSGKSLNQITAWAIEGYKSSRQKEITHYQRPPSKATINRELACLKHMFTKAVDWRVISSNPLKKVKLFPEKPNKLRVLSDDEFQKLYNEASDFLKPILVIAKHTGMRRSEILNLTCDDIDLVKRYIYVRDTKNNEPRIIPINETLFKTLKALEKPSQNKYPFANRNGDPVKSIKKAFGSALRRSGIAYCRLHDLRHTFASNLVMAGIDIVTVQELLGHKDIRITKRHSHPTPEHKKRAVESLNPLTMDTYLDTKAETKKDEGLVTT
jgi:integrase